MKSICFYFQVHQPFRLKKYRIFDIKNNHVYFDEKLNKQILDKVSNKCYLPTNNLILKLLNKYKGKFKVAYSITGTLLEQIQKHRKDVLKSFQDLAKTGSVEFLSETYYHSLSFLYSKEEFKEQVFLHKKLIKNLFNQEPITFRNTELIYNNELANFVASLGYKIILAEGADSILEWRSPNFVYKPKISEKINSKNKDVKLLLKNYRLSDDIAFRFSNKNWNEWPLTAEKFISWVEKTEGNLINLFMDYETFGEHQWPETGIFNFLEKLPEEAFKKNLCFRNPKDVVNENSIAEIDMPNFVSWADMERDLTAWLGNKMQISAMSELYAFEKDIKKEFNNNEKNNNKKEIESKKEIKKILEDWRKLTTSDHFYYMCTKWFSDGDVHKYFNPYDSPYDSYMSFMNVLNDIAYRLLKIKAINNNLNNSINKNNKLNKNNKIAKINFNNNQDGLDNEKLIILENPTLLLNKRGVSDEEF
ncbi:MAG: glycoside hydrolase family 57 protein [Candidatus Woesearchaeota archaeon]